MVELQLQIIRESSGQKLGMKILTVKVGSSYVIRIEEVAPNSCSAVGGLRVRYLIHNTKYCMLPSFYLFGLAVCACIHLNAFSLCNKYNTVVKARRKSEFDRVSVCTI